MKKLIITACVPFMIYAAEQTMPKTLEWENVLKNSQNKIEQIQLPALTTPEQTDSGKDFNVVAIMIINNKKYVYLLTPQSKTIKATEGLIISGKKIDSIDDSGITISDKFGNKSFLPILEKQVEEMDIAFSSKEKKEIR